MTFTEDKIMNFKLSANTQILRINKTQISTVVIIINIKFFFFPGKSVGLFPISDDLRLS